MSSENVAKSDHEDEKKKEDIELTVANETTPLTVEEDGEVKPEKGEEEDDKPKEEDRDPEQPRDAEAETEVKQPKRKFDFFENKWILLGILLVLLLAIIIVIIAIVATRQPNAKVDVGEGNMTEVDEAVANAYCGKLYGTKEDGGYAFRGIPYGKPPVGDLRWQPPVDVTTDENCWTSPFNATITPPSCYQKNGQEPMSEDCLYIDIFTPSVSPESQLPVMVYISADDVTFLKGVDGVLQPSAKVAKEKGMVFMRFNYRVGLFGYFSAPSLGETSGNYGLLDQVQALKWVRKNIDSFGGNAQKVTIFGVGSGAASVLALMASPLTKNLFHQAWIASGVEGITTEGNPQLYESLVTKGSSCEGPAIGPERAVCLRGWTAEEVAEADFVASQDDSVLFEVPPTSIVERDPRLLVNRKGDVLPKTTDEVILSASSYKVPLLIGSMAQEVSFYYMDGPTMSWEDFYTTMTDKLEPFFKDMARDDLTAQIQSLYPREVSAKYQQSNLVSDILVACPLDRLAKLASSNGYRTYRYDVVPKIEFDSDSYMLGNRWAYHGYDVAAYFGQLKESFQVASKFTYDLSKEGEHVFDINFKSFMKEAVHLFASTGEIKGWKEFSANSTTTTFEMDSGEYQATQSRAQKCKLWDQMELKGKMIRGWEF